MATQFRYDDATVLDLRLSEGTLHLDLECCTNDDDIFVNVSLAFGGTRNLLINGSTASTVSPLAGDGGIVAFKKNANDAIIVIEWNAFDPLDRKRQDVAYVFDFESFEMDVGDATKRPD
jgi:hypothetical protein